MKRLYDYGVLMVHGIGEARRADTLVRFSEPLITRIQELLSRQLGGAPPKKTVTAAVLYGQGAPAHAEVEFTGKHGAGEFTERWLFAEAWWAESFPTPSYSEISTWATEIIPSTLVAHFDERFRRLGYEFARFKTRGIREVFELILRWFAESLWLLIGLLLVPLLVLVLGLILLVGLIPNSSVRDFVGKIQRKLSATLGDSYVFMGREISAASIVGKVERDFHWLSSRCRQVVVVAHSQGAAVAHRALKNRPMRKEDLFVTLGSGLRKLTEIEQIKDNELYPQARNAIWGASLSALGSAFALFWITQLSGGELWRRLAIAGLTVSASIVVGSLLIAWQQRKALFYGTSPVETKNVRWLAGYLVLCGLIIWSSGLWSHAAFPRRGQLASLLVAGGLGAAFTALMRWRHLSGRSTHLEQQRNLERERYEKRYRFATTDLEWWDFYATSDPVSNGPLLDVHRPLTGYRYVEVKNFDSAIRDHTNYWANLDGFVTPLARDLLTRRGLVSSADGDDDVARRRRRWRVRWLVWARRTLGVVAFGIFLAATIQTENGESPWSDSAVQYLQSPEPSLGVALEAETPPEPEAVVKAETPPGWLLVFRGEFSLKKFLLAGAEEHRTRTAAILSLIYWMLAYGTVAFFWSLWNSPEARGLARYPRMSWGLFSFLLAFALACGGGLALGFWHWPVLAAGVLPIAGCWLFLAHLAEYGSVDEATEARRQTNLGLVEKAGADLVTVGWQLWDEVSAEEAVKTWRRAMLEQGSAEAAYLVSQYSEDEAECFEAAEYGAKERHAGATARLGEFFAERGDWDEAIASFALAKEFGATWVNMRLARVFSDSGRHWSASALLHEEKSRGNGDAATELGAAIVEAELEREVHGIPDRASLLEAVALLKEAIQLGSTRAVFDLAGAYKLLDDLRSARRALLDGADLGLAGSYYELGKLELDLEGDVDAAFAAFENELDRHPADVYAAHSLHMLGVIQAKRGRLDAAKRYYRTAAWYDNPWPSGAAACALGQQLESEHQSDRAEEAFERAVELDDFDGPAELVLFLARRGRPDEALERIRQAPTENEYPWAHAAVKLGDLLSKEYTSEEALIAYQRALELGSSYAKALVLRQLIGLYRDDEALEWVRAEKPEAKSDIHDLAERYSHKREVAIELFGMSADLGHVESVCRLAEMEPSEKKRRAWLTGWVASHRGSKAHLESCLRASSLEGDADFVAGL